MILPRNSLLNISRGNYLTIDWISTTSKTVTTEMHYPTFPLLHDWENWHECKARMGYTMAVKHTIGVVTMINRDRPDMGQHTIYSGKSLQRVEEMNGSSGIDVLKHHIENGHTIARLDIALDFINMGMSPLDFEEDFMKGSTKTRLKSASTVRSLTHDGHTFYLGSRKARKKLIRVYDKGAEQGIEGADWTRVELQLMGKPATNVGVELMKTGDVKNTLLGAIKSVAMFTSVDAFMSVLDGVNEVELGCQSAEKGDTRRWLEQQAIPALSREIILDADYWIQFQDAVFARVADITSKKGAKL